LRQRWKILIIFVVGAILTLIGAILVIRWFVGEAQVIGVVPRTLDLWSMGYIVTFLLHLIFWLFIYIGIPVLIAVAATYSLWWKKLPEKERKEYRDGHLFGKRSRKTDAGGGISFLIFIVFCIKVYLDIFGIPMALGGIWWIRHEMKKEP